MLFRANVTENSLFHKNLSWLPKYCKPKSGHDSLSIFCFCHNKFNNYFPYYDKLSNLFLSLLNTNNKDPFIQNLLDG